MHERNVVRALRGAPGRSPEFDVEKDARFLWGIAGEETLTISIVDQGYAATRGKGLT